MAYQTQGPYLLLIFAWIAAIAIVDHFAFSNFDGRLWLIWAMILLPYAIYKFLEAKRESRERDRT